MLNITDKIASELSVKADQINAAITLLDEGATVPFIARYRKEKTQGLDDTQLRTLEERLTYLRELEDRKKAILSSIEEQGKLTPNLKASIIEAETKTRIEDLYLPYKKKRVTKAQIAREAGLAPLAKQILNERSSLPETIANDFLNPEKKINTPQDALDGARQIIMEDLAEDADLIQKLREYLNENGTVKSTVIDGKESDGQKYTDYFDYQEQFNTVPSHRALALFRGRNEGILNVTIESKNEETDIDPCIGIICNWIDFKSEDQPADKWISDTIRFAWRVKIQTKLDMDLKTTLKGAAEEEAIKVFASNFKDLILAPPAGHKAIIGLDPGIRTGVKIAVINENGKLVDTTTIYPLQPQNKWDQSIEELKALCLKHEAKLISIGNGTGSRETDKLVKDMIKRYPETKATGIIVSEAGASVYSASEFAAREFPSLDVSLRGAVSIARRLQDPLAELVKIEPKAIGVGQYQHDVNQSKLSRTLDATCEDCVNAVGVDLNTASSPLLARVSGLNQTIATNIVEFRDQNGSFSSRNDLKKVPRLGNNTFEQAAGFLRISNGTNPLDKSAVHPESYPIVQKIIDNTGIEISKLIGNTSALKKLNPKDFITNEVGEPTVIDIIKELEKPGRDPRPEFKTANFKEGVEDIKDLKEGMVLEGVISNVTNFGAFVDLGVHQDGLVHISQLANKFVKDPRDVVKAGDIVKVKVMEVDIKRKRIGLSMRLDEPLENKQPNKTNNRKQPSRSPNSSPNTKATKPGNTAFADAFSKAGLG